MKAKVFTSIDGRLVSITTKFIYPPIPIRTSDYCAWYSCEDGNEERHYGWGTTPENAIQDLVDSYEDPDAPITFEYEYECDLIADRLQENAYQYLYYQEFGLGLRSHVIYGEAK